MRSEITRGEFVGKMATAALAGSLVASATSTAKVQFALRLAK